MQPNGSRWRELGTSKTESSLLDISRSRSKNNRYNPMRSSQTSDLLKKIKILSESKLDISGIQSIQKQYEPREGQEKSILKIFNESDKFEKFSPPKSQDSFSNELRQRKIRPLNSNNQNETNNSSSNILIQLRKIQKKQTKDEQRNPHYFTLNQQNIHIRQELSKIKTDFIQFKQLIHAQLSKQNIYMKKIVTKIHDQFNKIVETYCQQEIGLKVLVFEPIESRVSDYMEESLPQLSQIHKTDSPGGGGDSRVDLRKILYQDQNKLDKSISERMQELKNSRKYSEQHLLSKSKTSKTNFQFYRPEKINESTKNSCKIQFDKFFKAVDCLKNDIKDIKNLTYSHSKDQNQPQLQLNNNLRSEQRSHRITDLMNMKKSSLLLNKSKN